MLPPLLINGRPHWESRFPKEVWPAFEDFRNLLALVWDHLGLPEPTPAQYETAHRLQYGADSVEWASMDELQRSTCLSMSREDIIRCFRFMGKSYITSAFASWKLMRNPKDEHILVVSATTKKAKEFVAQTKGVMATMELTKWLLDGNRQGGAARRDTAEEFDVAGEGMWQSYSVQARGITGQITGSRATTLIADDIEILSNSKTEDARADILRRVRSDFGPITRTQFGKGDIVFLGTPQTEESVYNVLVKEMMYRCFTIPARFPAEEKLPNYVIEVDETKESVNILAPYLRHWYETGRIKCGQVTDTRLTIDELTREEAQGRAEFALQFMLDTSLSDAERYPLKQHDLMLFAVHDKKGPLMLQWGHDSDKRNLINDIPNQGFSGDYCMRPLKVDDEWRDYEGKVLWVDPAGRGKDETAWCVLAQLGGTLFILHIDAHRGDPNEAMYKIARDAKRFEVNVVEVEPNYGQGIWVAAFQPILTKTWMAGHKLNAGAGSKLASAAKLAQEKMGGCTIQESEWAKGQKEPRIIDTLEPVMTAHRLVLDETVARAQIDETEVKYSFLYQLTHITRDRGSLKHDDRVECVAGAVGHFLRAMEMDAEHARQGVMQAEKDAQIEDFLEMFEEGFPIGRKRGKYRAGGYRPEVYEGTA